VQEVLRKDYSLIKHLCWGVLLNHDPRRTWVAVMTEYAVYLDDSGHPNDQPYVIAAGFLSTEQGWLAFEPEWKAALAKHKIGDVFHMVEFLREKRSKQEEGDVLEDLTQIIRKHVHATFSAIVKMDDYKKVNDVYPLEESMGTPYAVAARSVAKFINEWKAQFFKLGDNLLVFIEDGTKHTGDMEEAFRRDHLPVPQKVPKSHPSVQPCDLLAWESFHFSKFQDNRRSLVNLLDVPFLREGIFRENNLVKGLTMIGVPTRASLPPNVVFVYGTSPKRIRQKTIK